MPGAAVDALSRQVGVSSVPGVLLDHVDEDVADAYGVIVERHLLPEVVLVERLEPLLRCGGFRLPRSERLLDDRGVGERKSASLSASRLNRRGGSVLPCRTRWNQLFSTWARVPDQPEQAQGARRNGAAGDLLGVETATLYVQGQPVVAEVLPQCCLLALGLP